MYPLVFLHLSYANSNKMLLKGKNMKCLIFSDSHGSPFYMSKALKLHRDAEVVFFLGDGLSDAEELAQFDGERMWIAVRGNCDFKTCFRDRPVMKSEEIVLEGRKIFATHGDLYSVKLGLENIKNLANMREVDIVLFGHTHIPREEYVDGAHPFYLFNPGSISKPNYTYGILTLTQKSVLFSHGKF